MANPSVTYTFVNSTTADATQVNQNFTDLINSLTDGTKSLTIDALTAGGTATFNGDVNLGNNSTDTITATGSFDSNLVASADATYGLGTSSIGWNALYLGANSNRVGILPSASMSATWNLTLPTTAGSTSNILRNNGSGALAWTGMTIDASDNLASVGTIGCGAISSTGLLTITKADTTPYSATSLVNNCILLDNTTTGANHTVAAYFRVRDVSAVAQGIAVQVESQTNAKSRMTWNTLGTQTGELMTLTSDGDLGLGTDSPGIVAGYSRDFTFHSGSSTDSNVNFELRGDRPSAGQVTASINVICGSSEMAYIDFLRGSSDNSGDIALGTFDAGSNKTGVYIEQSGLVGIGTTSPSYPLDVAVSTGGRIRLQDTTTLGNGESLFVQVTDAARSLSMGVTKHASITNPVTYIAHHTQDNVVQYLWVDDADQYRISSTGDHRGTTSGTVIGTQTSDERLKENIRPTKYGLSDVLKLAAIDYERNGVTETGFGAQTTMEIIPEAVYNTGQKLDRTDGEGDQLAMDYVRLLPACVKAIQELAAKVEALEAQLGA